MHINIVSTVFNGQGPALGNGQAGVFADHQNAEAAGEGTVLGQGDIAVNHA